MFRSVNSIVIPPARTGIETTSKTAVTPTDQGNIGILSKSIPKTRRLANVLRKLIAPIILEAPAKCNERMAQSTEGPEWHIFLLKGGYIVHPVPIPSSTIIPHRSIINEGTISQYLRLFIRGNAISGLPSIKGTNQFP